MLNSSAVILNYLQVKWSGVRTQHSTTPFVDDMYDRLKETLSDYEIIICRWPEYTFVLENVCQFGFILILCFFLVFVVILGIIAVFLCFSLLVLSKTFMV